MHAVALLLLACLASSTFAETRVSAASRAGRACLFEASMTTAQLAVGAPVVHNSSFDAISMAFWFRVEVDPSTFLFPILTYASASSSNTSVSTRYASLGGQSTAYLSIGDSTVYSLTGGINAQATWTHVAATWRSSDGDVRVYENGVLIANGTAGVGTTLPAGGRFFFPDYVWASKLFGVADDLTAWGVRLGPEEVLAVAQGNTSVRESDMVMHWACDEPNSTAAGTTIADSAAGAGGSAAVVAGSPVTRVPSQSGAKAGFTAVAVSGANATVLSFGEAVTVKSVNGTLGSVAAANGTSLVYTPPTGGLASGVVDSFETSVGTVYVHANIAPAPRALTKSVADVESTYLNPVHWVTNDTYSRQYAYNTDAEGYPLTVRVTVLPEYGDLYQADGTPITAAGTVVTDKLYRVLFNSTESDYNKVAYVGFSVSDEVDTVQVTHTIKITLPDRLPYPEDKSVSVAQDASDGVWITLSAVLNQGNVSSFVVSTPPVLGKLYDNRGFAVSYRSMSRLMHQWVSEVISFSSEYDDGTGTTHYHASNVIGKPVMYPASGASAFAWSMDDPPAGSGNTTTSEWIIVGYPVAVDVSSILVCENFYGNNVRALSVYDEINEKWVEVFSRNPPTAKQSKAGQGFEPELRAGLYPIRTRKVRVDITYFGKSYPQIDAIQLKGFLPVEGAQVGGSRVLYIPNAGESGADNFEYGVDLSGTTEAAVVARTPFWESPSLATVSIEVVAKTTVGCTDDNMDKVKGMVAGFVVAVALAAVFGVAALVMFLKLRSIQQGSGHAKQKDIDIGSSQ